MHRNMFKLLLATATTTVALVLTGGTAAWAGPAPLVPDAPGAYPAATGGATTTGLDTWQVAGIASACALAAVAVTLLAVYLAGRLQHRRVSTA